MEEYVTFIREAQKKFGLRPALTNDKDNKENLSENEERNKSSSPYNMIDVYESMKSRPTTGNINQRGQLSQSSEHTSKYDYGASKANEEIMSLRYNRRGTSNRNIRSAIPQHLTQDNYILHQGHNKPNFRRESIKKKTEKEMRHGKFSKFLDYLIDIKNEEQNTTMDDINSLMKSNDTSFKKQANRNMSAPGRARKKPTKDQISEYYILTIAKEADNYFQLDKIRKNRIRDMLIEKHDQLRRKANTQKEARNYSTQDPNIGRSVVINELEKGIMEVSEEIMQRRIKTSINNCKSKHIDIKTIQSQHLSNIGESFFKSNDKRRILRLFSNSSPIKSIIQSYIKSKNLDSLSNQVNII